MVVQAFCIEKNIANAMSVVKSVNERVTAIKVTAYDRSFLVVCMYMLTDYGDYDSLDEFTEICSLIQ